MAPMRIGTLSPRGGNVVKAAHYHGTAAGLRMAEAMIHEHLSNTERHAPSGAR